MHDDLFTSQLDQAHKPLAYRLRPQSLSDWIGHEKFLGTNGVIRAWLKTKQFPSILLWGPPGVGKTSLAMLIAEHLGDGFIQLSAVSSGVREIKEAAERARSFAQMGRKTLLFFDEIHRLNKSQQDSLLPHVESGLLTLIGATTENPSFEVNAALLSRLRVIRLDRLTAEDLDRVLIRALESEFGLNKKYHFGPEARKLLIEQSEGDARRLLTALDSVVLLEPHVLEWTGERVRAAFEKLGTRTLPYDKNGEEHYNVISAFIKSMRAGDPNATVYYLARLIAGGEDPMFIARRMIVFASEDIGSAEWRALPMAIAAKDALETIGMPEARISLAHVAISLSLAKKDRSAYDAIGAAMEEVEQTGALPVPMVLRNAVTALMRKEGYGKGDPRELLPDGVKRKLLYRPKAPLN